MEDQRPGKVASLGIVRRFPKDPEAEVKLPENFKPLRLVLEPGGMCLEIHKAEMVIGRHTNSDIRLSFPDISRRHCRLCFTDGYWEVLDLNSLNGVHVNGEKLKESVLLDGDILRIGDLTFKVEIDAPYGKTTRGPRRVEAPAGVLRSIVDYLPDRGTDGTKEYRKAS